MILRILLALLLCLPSLAHAGSYSKTFNATTGQNVTTTGIAWTDPTFTAVEDGKFTTNTVNPGDVTDLINGQTGALAVAGTGQTITITGVACETMMCIDIDDSAQILNAYLTTGSGTIASSSVAVGKPLTSSCNWGEKGNTVGADGEMWGLTSAGLLSIFGNKFFGCAVEVTEIGGNTVNISNDATRITVWYDIKAKTLANVGAGQ